MNPPRRMPTHPEAELFRRAQEAIDDGIETYQLRRFIGCDVKAWDRYNTRVHGIHQRLYWLLWKKKNENLGRFGKVAFEIVFREPS